MKKATIAISALASILTLTPFQRCLADSSIALSLEQAVKEALKNNLNLDLRRDKQAYAKGASQMAKAKFNSIFSFDIGYQEKNLTPVYSTDTENEDSASWSASLQKAFSFGTEVELKYTNSWLDTDAIGYLFYPLYAQNLTLGISQPLLKGFGTENQTAAIKAAEKHLQAATCMVDSQAAELGAQVKKAYWNLVYARQDIQVKKLSLQLAKRLLEETKEKIKVGQLAEIELYRPQSEVASREKDLISGERAIGTAEDQLKMLMNSRNWFTTIIPSDLPDTTPVNPAVNQVMRNALASRPDIKAANLHVEAAEFQEKNAKNNILPSLNFVASLGVGGKDATYGDTTENTLNGDETSWQVGLNFSIPLENSLAKGKYLQAKSSTREAKNNAKLLKQQVRQLVRTTLRNINLAGKTMEAASKTAYATLKGLEAEEVKFKAGRATTLDVLSAQKSYSTALSMENRSKIEYAKAIADLERIQGIITLNGRKIDHY